MVFMWHQKKDIMRRLYDLGLTPEQIDKHLNPQSPGQARDKLRRMGALDDRRDMSANGPIKAAYIIRAFKAMDSAMRYLTVDAPVPHTQKTQHQGDTAIAVPGWTLP